MKRCKCCNRIMLPWRPFWYRLYGWTPLRNRMNCGGDCSRCIEELEGPFEERVLRTANAIEKVKQDG